MHISYIHYRPADKKDPHGVAVAPKGGATVAISEDDTMLHFAIGRCSDRDIFNKKIGRHVALGRLTTHIAGKAVKTAFSIKRDSELPTKQQVNDFIVENKLVDQLA